LNAPSVPGPDRGGSPTAPAGTAAAAGLTAPDGAQAAATAPGSSLIEAVLTAFQAHRVVAVGDAHACQEVGDLLPAAVRDSAAATGLVLGLLYLFPILASFVSDATLARRLQQIGPLSAGLDVQATTRVKSLPLTPWQGLGVVALWTAGALLLGALALKFRDA